MAYTTINKSSDHFNTVTYTGNGASNRAVTSGFATDFVWIKNRGTGDDNVLFNKTRGGTKYIYANDSSAETTYSSQDVTFESTGINVGSYSSINQNGGSLVSHHWKANGSTVLNTDGSNASTVSANSTAGFSIVAFTGTGANATVGHGLGSAPKMIMIKALSAGNNWGVYHAGIGATKYLRLNATNAEATHSGYFQDTTPTSSVFSLGSDGNVNASGADMIAFCFSDKTGYSKFNSYTGNGNADGSFIYTGFKPEFVMVKATGSTGYWTIIDNKRTSSGNNPIDKWLYANVSDTELNASSYPADFLSNGFKIRHTGSYFNTSGETYIYMAFAEAPLVGSNNVPCTAR